MPRAAKLPKINLHPRHPTPDHLPPVASARQLTTDWEERDHRYGLRKSTGGRWMRLTDAETLSIMTYRRGEAKRLTEARDRSYALGVLSLWQPPAVMS